MFFIVVVVMEGWLARREFHDDGHYYLTQSIIIIEYLHLIYLTTPK